MFVGLDGVVESLTNSVSATETEFPVSGNIGSLLGSNTSKLRVTDGVYVEYISVTGTAGTKLVVSRGADGTTARAWPAGACVSYVITTAIVCEFIAQGGCNSSIGTCTPVSYGTKSIPAAVIGSAWSAVVAFTNSTGIVVDAKPSWVTSTVNGTAVILTGTPPIGAVSEPIIVRATGCSSSVVVVHDTVSICEQVSA